MADINKLAPIIYIYTLADPISNEIRYVGKSNNPRLRYNHHLCASKKTKTKVGSWIISLNNRGLKPKMEILDKAINNWEIIEQYWISQFKAWGFRLCNLTDGGEGALGIKRTKETQDKINSTRSKSATKQKGRKWTEESKARVSNTLYGVKKPKGFSEKLTISKGSPVIQKTLDGTVINEFPSTWEAVRKTGIWKVHAVCIGKRKSAGNYIFEYKK